MNAGELPQRLAVMGLGYVGLSLAVAFAKHFPTIGFDLDAQRIKGLKECYDRNGEVPPEALSSAKLHLTDEPGDLRQADFLIVAVPTPVDRANRPDLTYLVEASRLVGQALKSRASCFTLHSSPPVVVYESTVYPGCTEEVCIPILERESGLRAGLDFKVGYSPERINPGDPEHGLENVVKVVAGQDEETTELLARVYGLVVKAGIYKAPNIKTAEAAKVIENVQRDLNIALMNDLSMLFHRLGLDTQEVLKAARTKWNFLPFEPGFVGGHCIPVDPYYLTHKAQEIGYHPEVILAGRRINDYMGRYAAQETVRLLIQVGKTVRRAEVLVLGVAFKENVRDVRNSRVLDLIRELEGYGCRVVVYDPVVGREALEALGLKVIDDPFSSGSRYDSVVLAVPHRSFQERPAEAYLALLKDEVSPGVLIDIKGVLSELKGTNPNVLYWRL